MKAVRRSAGWRLGFIALALIAGFLTGLLLRESVSSAVGASVGGMRTCDSPSIQEPENQKRATTRNSRDTRDSLVFSRLQWSKLMRNPKLMNIPLLEYLPPRDIGDSIPAIDDIPQIAKLFGPQKPDGLRQAAEFFGWDEKQVGSVDSALETFGRNLAEAEKSGARMEDLESGGVRTFPTC